MQKNELTLSKSELLLGSYRIEGGKTIYVLTHTPSGVYVTAEADKDSVDPKRWIIMREQLARTMKRLGHLRAGKQ